MKGLQGLVYFDGKNDYVLNKRDIPLDKANLNVCYSYTEFINASLDLLLKDTNPKSISVPMKSREDITTQRIINFIKKSTGDVKVIKQGGEAIKNLAKKYNLSNFQMIPFNLEPGATYPTHKHTSTIEAFYVVKGAVVVGNKIYYEGDRDCFDTNKPHHYVNPLKNSGTKLAILFSPFYNSTDCLEAKLKTKKDLCVKERNSYIISRTDVPLLSTDHKTKPKYIIFIEKEYGETGPFAIRRELFEKIGEKLEEVIITEWKKKQDPRITNGEVNHTNSILIAGSLQSSYIYTMYQYFDKLPRVISLYCDSDMKKYIAEREIAGDYLIGLRNIKKKGPMNLIFVESKTSENTHLKHREIILERCRERGIDVKDNIYREGDDIFSLKSKKNYAVLIDCLDRISLVKDIQERFGKKNNILFRAFNPLVLGYYGNSKS